MINSGYSFDYERGKQLKNDNIQRKALIVAGVAGFLPKFEMGDAQLLKELGYEVHYASNTKNVVYEFNNALLEDNGIKIHNIPIGQNPLNVINMVVSIHKLKNLIKKEKFELVHCHTPFGGCVARLATRKFKNIKIIYTAHGFYFYNGCSKLRYKLFYLIENWLAKYTDVIVTINHEDYEMARNMRIRENGRLYYIPGVGVDMEYYNLSDGHQADVIRKQIGADGRYIIISVGELRANKNQYSMIKAIEVLEAERSDILYVIIGEGRQRRKLENYVKNKKILNVIFTGYVSDVRPYIAACDAMVFPSIREGLGMAALEALSMGKPVIAADNRGTREYIIKGVNGWLVNPKNIDGYVSAIKELIETGKCTDAITNRKSVNKFSKQNSLRIMRHIYEETTDKRNNVCI